MEEIEMREGIMVYDFGTDRYDIRFGLEEYYRGLHCGECLEIEMNGKWIPVRIEMDGDWYLVGAKFVGQDMLGLKVRI